jgi:hypothetical protein
MKTDKKSDEVLLQYGIYCNANHLGWKVAFRNRKIILRKKKKDMTQLDKDTKMLIKALLTMTI